MNDESSLNKEEFSDFQSNDNSDSSDQDNIKQISK